MGYSVTFSGTTFFRDEPFPSCKIDVSGGWLPKDFEKAAPFASNVFFPFNEDNSLILIRYAHLDHPFNPGFRLCRLESKDQKAFVSNWILGWAMGLEHPDEGHSVVVHRLEKNGILPLRITQWHPYSSELLNSCDSETK